MTEDERDELLAWRISAMLTQHDYNGQLVRSVIGLRPYPGRTANRMNWREYLQPDCEDNPTPHALWPGANNPADWTDEPTPEPT